MTIPNINLAVPIETLRSLLLRLEALDGLCIEDPDSTRKPKEAVAEVTREILFAEHALKTASVLIKNEYWLLKGYHVGFGVYLDEEPELAGLDG